MATRVVIHHLGGSKVNQIEQFPLGEISELTIGRDPSMTIALDPTRDDAVSRRHAVIKIVAGEPPTFKIADSGSSNGTFVNDHRIIGEGELMPGDVVELGSGGPKFSFDLDPRPMVPARTRVMSAASPSSASAATRMIDSAVSMPVTGTFPPATGESRPTIGRNTVMRLLTEQKQSHARMAMYGLAGILVVVGAVGGALYYKNYLDNRNQQAQIAQQKAELVAKNDELQQQLKKEQDAIGLNPQQIAERFGNSTVWIQMQWRLYDRGTGKPLFHKTVEVDGHLLPAYVSYNGNIYRWLTTEDELGSNKRVGAAGTGTGFVVSSDGLIFTNKHVAAGWKINYNAFSSYEHGQGVLYKAQPTLWNDNDPKQKAEHAKWLQDNPPKVFDLSDREAEFREIVSWQPEEGGPLFANSQPIVVSKGDNVFEGRDEELSVRFPGSRVDVTARLLRASSDADAALIKIDTSQSLAAVTIAQNDHVDVGEKVTVLGYPAFSEQNVAVFKTRENSETRTQEEVIPAPTVTTGNISNISEPTHQAGDVTIVGTMGDVYQMSLPSGAGNSGGPVFNAKGDVIGIFTYGNRSNQTVTYAVPIHYARDLMQLQKM
ncbi:MAG TPA: trypsin-like peptidase domain-containing protein [Stellaceae bacterium]|nr:trypsin-like peptidase domain-containing protein [Stellaceae bacterium]